MDFTNLINTLSNREFLDALATGAFVGGIVVTIAAVFTLFGRGAQKQAITSQNWASVPGQIISSRVTESTSIGSVGGCRSLLLW
jgi:hypothetical protein